MFEDLQYRIPTRFSRPPGEPTTYVGRSKLRANIQEDWLESVRGKTVSDFGCGEGLECRVLSQIADRVIGMDIEENARRLARQNNHDDGATKFSEVEGGLNKMTITRFETLVRRSDLEVKELSMVSMRKFSWAHSHLTREFTTSVARGMLVRPSTAAKAGLERERVRRRRLFFSLLLLAETSPEYTHAISKLRANSEYWRAMSSAGRDLVAMNYDWSAIGANLFAVQKGLRSRQATPSACVPQSARLS